MFIIPAKKIAILNLKGGTAKTTTTRNFGCILAADYNKKVLLLDLDSSGDLSSTFSLRPKDGDTHCISELLVKRDLDPHDYILHTKYPNVDLLPSNDTLAAAETFIRSDERNPQQLRLLRQMEKIEAEYDYIIADCPPTECLMVINALVFANEVITPVEISQDSINGMLRTVSLMNDMTYYNPSLKFRGVLFTRISNNAVDRDGVTTLQLPVPRFNTYIRSSVDVGKSRFQNVMVREYKRSCNPAHDYDNAVAEYMGARAPYPMAPYVASPVHE